MKFGSLQDSWKLQILWLDSPEFRSIGGISHLNSGESSYA